MLNRIILIGRLTKDPELRYTQNGTPVATFTLAVDRAYKNAQGEKETDFINIVAWRQLGQSCDQYLAKGKLAAVDGSLRLRSYTGNDGIKRTIAEVIAEQVRFLSPKDGSSGSSARPPNMGTNNAGGYSNGGYSNGGYSSGSNNAPTYSNPSLDFNGAGDAADDSELPF